MPFGRIIDNLASHIAHLPVWFYYPLLLGLSFLCLRSFYLMVTRFRTAQTIQNVPTAKIRSAAQGYVELSGLAKLVDGPIIVSPLSGKACVWYSYKIEEHVRHGKDRHWQIVEQKRSDDLFLLEDDTGRCIIDPDGADVVIDSKRVWHKRHVVPPRRYTEQLIREGDPLYAIGFFKSLGDIDNMAFRERVSVLLRQWKMDPNQLLDKYDLDRNNELDVEEYEQVRLAAERQVRRDIGAETKEAQLHVIAESNEKQQPYILSSEEEPVVIRRYQLRALKALIGFFISGIVVIWMINSRAI